ncbi:unnamed protein product [Strongylus vulgaris]|uniref:Uncharacterized protein n=1 Tax=Strongylus vulgaris TaxID=40348 RepID=A0A3P7IGQ6_STRVU|nr:unnamed protein product [Strongylus vulgaris]
MVNIFQKEISSKLGAVEREGCIKEKELQEFKCRLKALEALFEGHEEKKNWNFERWELALAEQTELKAYLESELRKNEENLSATEVLGNKDESDDVAEGILALEQDLLTYINDYNEERRKIQEQKSELLPRLNAAQNKVMNLNSSNAEKENEHQRLLCDVKNLQAQIDAFSNLHTPAKPATMFGVKSRRTMSSGRHASRGNEEVDSENSSSPSGVPYVEGLQPFSPATLSVKEQAKSKSKRTAKCETIGNVRLSRLYLYYYKAALGKIDFLSKLTKYQSWGVEDLLSFSIVCS